MQVRYHTVGRAIMHIIISSATGSDEQCMPSRRCKCMRDIEVGALRKNERRERRAQVGDRIAATSGE